MQVSYSNIYFFRIRISLLGGYWLDTSRNCIDNQIITVVIEDNEKTIEISQNIHNYWQLGDLEEKRKLQKVVFPEGIVIDTKNREYLSSKVNSLFLAKSQNKWDTGGANKKLPTENGGESSLVAGVGLIYAAKALIINYRYSRTNISASHYSSYVQGDK